MRTIHKFPVPISSGDFKICGHWPLTFIHVALDCDGVASVWAEVDTRLPKRIKDLHCVFTGGMMSSNAVRHLGSVTLPSHGLVCHYYEE